MGTAEAIAVCMDFSCNTGTAIRVPDWTIVKPPRVPHTGKLAEGSTEYCSCRLPWDKAAWPRTVLGSGHILQVPLNSGHIQVKIQPWDRICAKPRIT